MELKFIYPDTMSAIMPVMEQAFDPKFGEAWTVEQCRSTMLLPGTNLIAAIDNEKVLAFAMWLTVLENSELLLLAVVPQVQNSGIGRKLLEEWTDNCVNNDAQNQFIEVRENNNAVGFYKKFGFNVIGKRADYYSGSNGLQLSALTMRRCLR